MHEQMRGNASAATGLLQALLERSSENRFWLTFHCAEAVRAAIADGALDLAERLLAGAEGRPPRLSNAVLSARAALAEAKGELEQAAALYGDAVDRWHEFGFLLEEGQALLGVGRCFLALRAEEAVPTFTTARAIFARLEARPLLAETDALLAKTRAVPA
jgi:tetratricopeptide (TPR) repeat protein